MNQRLWYIDGWARSHRARPPTQPSPLMHPMRQRTLVSAQMRNYILNAHVKSATDPRRLLHAWGGLHSYNSNR